MKVDAETFAGQVNYLAAIGRFIVPRALVLADYKFLFVGHAPFHPEELGSLLPEETDWHEFDFVPTGFVPSVVVVGREGFDKNALSAVFKDLKDPPKVIPQEGFLDELLFGHDWWDEEVESLRAAANHHRGLQLARSVGALSIVSITQPQPKKAANEKQAVGSQSASGSSTVSAASRFSRFFWPGTEAKETKNISNTELELQPQSRLKQLGYDTTKSRSERWRILREKAVPELGLPKVASFIAWLCRTRKSQKGGRQTFANSIAEWEHDLARLRRELYPDYKHQFRVICSVDGPCGTIYA